MSKFLSNGGKDTFTQMIQEPAINFSEHLEELRRRIIICLILVAALSVIGFFMSDFLLDLVALPIQRHVFRLYFFRPYEAFMVQFKVAFAFGVILSLPVILIQLWRFMAPALYQREKKTVMTIAISCAGLFFLGALFAYFVVIPIALTFFLDFRGSQMVPLISIDSYLSFFLSLILTFGLFFNVPAVLLGLIFLKVIGTSFLSCQRKLVIVLIFILAAILTPTVDVVTQCLVAFTLWALFEASIWIGRRIERRWHKQNR